MWSDDPESYAGGSVATVKVFLARQVKLDNPSPWGFGVGLSTLPRETNHMLRNLKE